MPGDLVRRRLAHQADERAGELVAEVRDEVADRAQQAGRGRHDHGVAAHQLRDRVRVQRPRAAEGDEREVARIVAALHRHQAQGAGHVLVDDREDAVRGLLEREVHRVGDRLHGGARGLDVERHLAAQEARRQVADDDVRVGHGRLGAALAVGRRAGLGAGRLRPDAERAGELRHVCDRAAARAHRVDVDARDLDAEVADRRLAPDRRLAVLAQRDVGGRPAHVEREDVRVARLDGHVERAGDAAGGAGEHAVDRVPLRLGRRHQARVGAQDVDVAGRAELLERALQPLDVRRRRSAARTSSCRP